MARKKNNRRILNGDGEWTYRCSLCRQYKTDNHFHSDNSKPPFNLAYNCKECRKNSLDRPPMLLDWEHEQGYETLRKMGFNIKDDIHQQFIDRVKDKYGVTIV